MGPPAPQKLGTRGQAGGGGEEEMGHDINGPVRRVGLRVDLDEVHRHDPRVRGAPVDPPRQIAHRHPTGPCPGTTRGERRIEHVDVDIDIDTVAVSEAV